MMNGDAIKELVVVVADVDAELTARALLKRHESLGIRPIEFDVQRHIQRDPGCRTAVHSFLQPETSRYKYALIIFDWEGAGAEDKSPEAIEADVEAKLAACGWRNRCAVVVIKPELEIWVWSDSPHVQNALGWEHCQQALQTWLKKNTSFWSGTAVKPERPKEALNAALREVRKSASPVLFKMLAERVSTERCNDRAFTKFKTVLKQWFGHN